MEIGQACMVHMSVVKDYRRWIQEGRDCYPAEAAGTGEATLHRVQQPSSGSSQTTAKLTSMLLRVAFE